jgi:protein TonB
VKRLLFAAFLAVCIHAVLFLVELPWARPTLVVPFSRAVDIELVTFQKPNPSPALPDPEAAKPAPKRKPHIQPIPKPKVKTRPKPVAKAEVPPIPAAKPLQPDPIPLPAENETLEETVPIDEALPSQPLPAGASPQSEDSGDAADNRADVRASEPLYHLNPPPSYPRVARRRNYQGTVVLDVLVTADGVVADVRVAASSGYAILDRSALNTVKAWRFAPARKGRQPIEMWVQVPVRFELR